MKKLVATATLLGLVVLGSGCASSGYPDAEDRIENIEETIKEKSLTGESVEARDKRFKTQVGEKN